MMRYEAFVLYSVLWLLLNLRQIEIIYKIHNETVRVKCEKPEKSDEFEFNLSITNCYIQSCLADSHRVER